MASPLTVRCRAGVLLACILACYAVPASAQTAPGGIDPYMPPAAAGGPLEFAPDAGLVARSRPVAAPPGLILGSVSIQPALSESLGVESNPGATSTPRGSMVVQTDAAINAAFDDGSTTLGAQARVSDVVYPQLSALSHTDYGLVLAARRQLGLDAAFVNYSHQQLSQSPGGLNTNGLSPYLPFSVDDARLGYKLQLSRFSIIPTFELTSYSFSNGSFGGTPVIETDQNRISYTGSVTTSYGLSTGRSLVLIADLTQALYGAQSSGAPRPNYVDGAALAGIDYDADAVIRYRALVGYEVRRLNNAAYQAVQAPVAQLSAVWTPTAKTMVTVTTARIVQASALGFTQQPVTYNYGQVNLDHELSDSVRLRASIGAALQTARQLGTEALVTAGTGASYAVNRYLSVDLSYSFTARTAASGGAALGNSYTDHRIVLQLRAGL